jgi:hypothetical protein
MATMTTNFDKLLEPVITQIYGDAYKDYDEKRPKIYDVQKSTRKKEDSLGLAGLGLLAVKPEGAAVSYRDPVQGAYKQWTNVSYALGFAVTREMVDFDQHNKIKAMPKMLKRSVLATKETVAAVPFNTGFTAWTSADGQYFFDSDHPLETGGTWSNIPASAADLSLTALEQALIDIGDWVDGAGLPVAARPKQLIIPSELDWTAKQLLKSTLDPENIASNAINPAEGLMPYLVWHYLTDADAWFIQTDVPFGAVFYMSREDDLTRDNDFDTENAKYKVIFRGMPAVDDARSFYGCTGA